MSRVSAASRVSRVCILYICADGHWIDLKPSSDATWMKGVGRGVLNPAVVVADSMMDREAFEAKKSTPIMSRLGK